MDTTDIILRRIINDIKDFNDSSKTTMILISIRDKQPYVQKGFDYKKVDESEVSGSTFHSINEKHDKKCKRYNP